MDLEATTSKRKSRLNSSSEYLQFNWETDLVCFYMRIPKYTCDESHAHNGSRMNFIGSCIIIIIIIDHNVK